MVSFFVIFLQVCVCMCVYVCVCVCVSQQHKSGLRNLIVEVSRSHTIGQTHTHTHKHTHTHTNTHTHTHTHKHTLTHKHTQYNPSESVISSSQRSLPMQHEKHKEKQPCPQWDSNPQSRQSSGSSFTTQTHGKQDLLLIQSAPFSLCFCFRHFCCIVFCFVTPDFSFFFAAIISLSVYVSTFSPRQQ